MVGPSNSAQRVLVHHAGGTIKLPLLPTDSVKSLRRQIQLLGLRPYEAQRYAQHRVQLRDDQTMEQAGLLGSRHGVTVTELAAPAAAPSAAAGAGADAGATCSLWVRGPASMQIFVSPGLQLVKHCVCLA
jgi:hypothetical protein